MKQESTRAVSAQTATDEDASIQAEVADTCNGCGGPYRFDISIPSVLWNQVVRSAGMPEYLCGTCIIAAFVRSGVSFSAELFGDGFSGDTIEVRVNGSEHRVAMLLDRQNTALRSAVLEIYERVMGAATAPSREVDSATAPRHAPVGAFQRVDGRDRMTGGVETPWEPDTQVQGDCTTSRAPKASVMANRRSGASPDAHPDEAPQKVGGLSPNLTGAVAEPTSEP